MAQRTRSQLSSNGPIDLLTDSMLAFVDLNLKCLGTCQLHDCRILVDTGATISFLLASFADGALRSDIREV